MLDKIELFIKKMILKFKVNGKPYNLDSFLSVEPYIKDLIVDMYNNEITYDTQDDLKNFKINKGLVDKILDEEDITIPEIKNLVKVTSLVIEGNDISGKETYSYWLYDKMNAIINTNKDQISGYKREVHLLSFPNYSGQIGKFIEKYLRKPRKSNFDRYVLNWLFYYDRINLISNYIDSFNARSFFSFYHHVLIFDRFYQSNWVYNQYIKNDPIVDWILRSEKILYASLNIKDMIIFHRDKKEPDEIHDKLILNKPGKDLNETVEFQQIIRDRFLSSEFKKKVKVTIQTSDPVLHYFTVNEVINENKPRDDKFIDYLHKDLLLSQDLREKL